MPALLDRVFDKSLKRGEFERVYYFHGDDDFLKFVGLFIIRADDQPIGADFARIYSVGKTPSNSKIGSSPPRPAIRDR